MGRYREGVEVGSAVGLAVSMKMHAVEEPMKRWGFDEMTKLWDLEVEWTRDSWSQPE